MILFNFVRQSDAAVIVYIVITDLDDNHSLQPLFYTCDEMFQFIASFRVINSGLALTSNNFTGDYFMIIDHDVCIRRRI